MGRVAKRHISVPYRIGWWPLQNDHEPEDRTADYVMSQAAAEQVVPEDTTEDIKTPFETPTKIRENLIGSEPAVKIRSRAKGYSKREDFLPHKPTQRGGSRIHVLGAGTLGRFVAHSLASSGDSSSITLLSHRSDITRQWNDEGRKLEVITGNVSCSLSGIDVRHVSMLGPQAGEGEELIDKLIITMQANATVAALLEIKQRLLPSSTICFLQSGMGVIDDVNATIFPNPATRPRYMVGLTSCGVQTQRGRTFTTMYTRRGNTYLSIVPKGIDLQCRGNDAEESLVQRMYYGWTASSRNLMRSLLRCPNLNAKGYQYGELLQLQLEKLAIDAVLGPLSVVFNCAYGKLLQISAARQLMAGLLGEIITVAHNIPELQKPRQFKSQFTLRRLELLILRITSQGNHTPSLMFNDVRNGRRTDINFLNGYIVKRGEELGIPCPVNSTLIKLISVKQKKTRSKTASFIPLQLT